MDAKDVARTLIAYGKFRRRADPPVVLTRRLQEHICRLQEHFWNTSGRNTYKQKEPKLRTYKLFKDSFEVDGYIRYSS